ncbi:hypothetical protein GEV29_10875 [Aeromicrobium sp. SMF47]|uniref:hypothetical protein n=1 Tax=Aeromicrobium yanjiei TaxID=2662028 RepID=UPI00129DBDA0|nr:hypothetical protein [Aeromicrobium yanjiei]MRJ77044.1 hypothetical protein [Aeromicrobium yanjiei]
MRIFKHPLKKLTLLTAFGGGYVLGAKAGRERYEQIRQAAQQVKSNPRVQQATAQAEDRVREAATKVTEDPRIKSVVERGEDVLRDAGFKGSDDQSSSSESSSSSDDAPAGKHSSTPSSSTPSSSTPSSSAPSPADMPAAGPAAGSAAVNPLLADDHVAIEDEIVYTSGPDIEESIDELVDTDVADQPISGDRRGDA